MISCYSSVHISVDGEHSDTDSPAFGLRNVCDNPMAGIATVGTLTDWHRLSTIEACTALAIVYFQCSTGLKWVYRSSCKSKLLISESHIV